MKHRKSIVIAVIVLALLVGGLYIFRQESLAPGKNGSQNGSIDEQSALGVFNRSQYPTDKAGSIWWIVNKKNPLPAGYVPNDLVTPDIPIRPDAGSDEKKVSKRIAVALEKMITESRLDGIRLMLASGYRSYATQAVIYDRNVRSLGQAEADRVSAKPGTSEHQTGLVADVEPTSRECEIEVCFGTMTEGKWVAEHAWEYGFIIRYPKGKEAITGYSYEPWHLRFVGRELASEMRKTGIQTLEEFFQ